MHEHSCQNIDKSTSDSPIVVAGSGRSGTTWVLDVLAKTHGLVAVFEPLNPLCVPEATSFANIYLQPNDNNIKLELFLKKVFKGEKQNLWTKYRMVQEFLIPSMSDFRSWRNFYSFLAEYKKLCLRYWDNRKSTHSIYITKFIRANLFLQWMLGKFNIRLIFIVRHPCSVICSKIAAANTFRGDIWKFSGSYQEKVFEIYRKNECLCQEHFPRLEDLMGNDLSEAAWHAVIWCIENTVPVKKLTEMHHPIFFYEDIVLNPGREFARMGEIIGYNLKPDEAVINSPSQQASIGFKEAHSDSFPKLDRWRNVLRKDEIDEIEMVLKHFDVNFYSTGDLLPLRKTSELLV